MTNQLPVAGPAAVRRAGFDLIRLEGRAFGWILLCNGLATAAGLVGPWLLGKIIDDVRAGGGLAVIDRLALLILVATIVQLVFTRYARLLAARFGERLSAHIRDQFLTRILHMPPSVVERIATGDLAARGAGDVATVARTMRDAAPDMLIAVVTTGFLLIAVFVVNPLLGLCGVVGYAAVPFVTRWYLRRARPNYIAMGAATSTMTDVLVTSAIGARTVDALSLRDRRIGAAQDAIDSAQHHRLKALGFRSVLYPTIDVSYVLPLVGVLLLGGVLYLHGAISLGAVVTSALYLRQLTGPIETFSMWIDQVQAGAASFARLAGLAEVPTTAPTGTGEPDDNRIDITDVRYAYDHGKDVLHGVDLRVRFGERLAVVGPSGAGKSTLGKLLAGIDHPRTGSITVGGVAVSELSPERLRREIVLVTQEHHVFHASIRDNLLIAKPAACDTELHGALHAVGADWVAELPNGLDTDVSPGECPLNSAQAQQIALARVVLVDPHTLVLDEATAMLDPTTARATERALSAVLAGRTVIAIAHRLHTARDADRVAVLDDGRLVELGTHDDLVGRDGVYARLWHSWHGDPAD